MWTNTTPRIAHTGASALCALHQVRRKRRTRNVATDAETSLPVEFLDYEMLEEQIVFLALKKEQSGALLACDCDSKGPSDALVIRQMVQDIEGWGRRGIRLKSDSEPAIFAMQTAAAARKKRSVLRNSPQYDPQSNVGAEKAV